jgi:hypothetical protein
MINRHAKLSVRRQFRQTYSNISWGSVYYSPKPVSGCDLDVMRQLDELYLIHPFMETGHYALNCMSKASRSAASLSKP